MKKVFKSIIASALPQLVNIISNLILPGMIILKFGSEINGLVSTTKTIISYISIVGAGIATAVTQSLYRPVAKNDVNEINGMLHAANKMFVKYGLIYLLITLIVSIVYPFCIKTDIKFIVIMMLLVVMSISGASEFFVTGRCRALLYAKQETYISNVIQAISLAISLVAAIIMLKLNCGIIIVELSISLVYILRAGFLLLYINLRYPEFRKFRKEEPIYSTVKNRKDAMIHQISGLVVTGSQSLILTLIVGLEAASIYSVYFIVFNGIQSICANLSTAITPFLGREIAIENDEKAKKVYNLIEFSFIELLIFVYSVTIFMVIPFVSVYTKNTDINYVYKDFAIIFTFSSLFYILKVPSNSVIVAAGYFKETRWRAILEAVICLVASIILSLAVGKNGVLIGSLIALTWRCIDTIVYSNKVIFEQSFIRSLLRIIKTIIIVGLSGVLSYLIEINVNNYFDWIKYAVIVSLIVLFIVLLDCIIIERKSFVSLLKTVFRKN